MAGLEDGKKRALFVLVNFLTSVGWSYDQIDGLLKKWNENNPEPLREVYLLGQVRYHKQNKKKVMPPNCENKAYFKDMQICKPDTLCGMIKNPVNYAIRKGKILEQAKPKQKKKDKAADDSKSLPEPKKDAD